MIDIFPELKLYLLHYNFCAKMNFERERLKTFESWPSDAIVEKGKIAKAGFYYLGDGFNVKCHFCSLIISDWKYGDKVMLIHKTLSPECAFVKDHFDCDNVPLQEVGSHPEYRILSNRLQSLNGSLNDVKLAKSGFFRNSDGQIICAYCGFVFEYMGNENPDVFHFEFSPHCPYLTRINPNSPLNNIVNLRTDCVDLDTDYGLAVNDLEQLGVLKHRMAVYPKYSTYGRRCKSFPEDCYQMLAEAGFFYDSDMKDKIICYHCGGTLANWNKCEDPWIPHARYYPNCDFLRLVKGDDFIDEALNISGLGPRHKNTNIESVASGLVTPDTSDMVTKSLVQVKEMRKVSDVEILRAFECLIVQEALDRGASTDQLSNVINARLSAYGRMFDSLDDLLESLSSESYRTVMVNARDYVHGNYHLPTNNFYEDLPDSFFPWRLRHRFGSPYYYFRRLMLINSRQLVKREFYSVVPLNRPTMYNSVFRVTMPEQNYRHYVPRNLNVAHEFLSSDDSLSFRDSLSFGDALSWRSRYVLESSSDSDDSFLGDVDDPWTIMRPFDPRALDSRYNVQHTRRHSRSNHLIIDDDDDDDVRGTVRNTTEHVASSYCPPEFLNISSNQQQTSNPEYDTFPLVETQSTRDCNPFDLLERQILYPRVRITNSVNSETRRDQSTFTSSSPIQYLDVHSEASFAPISLASFHRPTSSSAFTASSDTLVHSTRGHRMYSQQLNPYAPDFIPSVSAAYSDISVQNTQADLMCSSQQIDPSAPVFSSSMSTTFSGIPVRSTGGSRTCCRQLHPTTPNFSSASTTTSDVLDETAVGDVQNENTAPGNEMDVSMDNKEIVDDDSDFYKKKVRLLETENSQLKDSRLCKICMDQEVSVIFLKCGHLCVCSTCAATASICPICRKVIIGTIRAYLS